MSEEMEVPLESSHDAIHEEAEKTRDRWTLVVAMCTAILAVFAAITSLMAGHHANEAMIDQLQASDQWSFYQAKSIKQHLDDTTLAQLTRSGTANDPALAGTTKKLQDDLARYDKEKAEIKAKAEGLEKVRDDASRRSGKMGMAISYLTVAIATASICTVTKKKPLWFVAMILALVGVLEMVLAWTL